MKKKYKVMFGALAAAVIIALAFIQALRPEAVDVLEVQPRTIYHSFTEDGTVKAGRALRVRPSYSGELETIEVEEGDAVERGAVLARLDTTEQEYTLKRLLAELDRLEGERVRMHEPPAAAKIRQAETAIELAGENLRIAEDRYRRLAPIYERGNISEVEWEQARDTYQSAKLHLKQREQELEALIETHEPTAGSLHVMNARRNALEAQVALLRYQINRHSITAPYTGVVADIEPEVGDLVGPETPLLTLLQLDELRVEADVRPRDLHGLEPGMEVELIAERRDQDVSFGGKVLRISPHARIGLSPLGLEEDRVRVTIIPEIPSDLRIGPGYKLDVAFRTETREDQLVVPRTAVFTVNGEDALLVVEKGRAVVRRVTTDFETRREVSITEGLNPGDQVILDPRAADLDEGARVTATVR